MEYAIFQSAHTYSSDTASQSFVKTSQILPNTHKHVHPQAQRDVFTELISRFLSIFVTSFVCGQNTQTPHCHPFFTVLFPNWKEKFRVLKDTGDHWAQKCLWKGFILSKSQLTE